MRKRLSIPLNSLEKFMLAHESEYVSYNSQIMVEFNGEVRLHDLQGAIDKALNEIPLLKSKIEENFLNFHRYYHTEVHLSSNDVLESSEDVLTQDAIDAFSQKKFNLNQSPPFRFLLGKTAEGKNILIFNVHHTLCDAAGQFHLLEEIFLSMNGKEIREGAKTNKVFRYRDLYKYLGLKWVLKQVITYVRPVSKQRQYRMASLVDHHEKPQRSVTSMTLHLQSWQQDKIRESCKKLDISITEYLTYCCFKALDKSLKERGDSKTPIMVYLPKTLRPLLKIRYSLQNILSTVWIVGKRDEINDLRFLGKIKHIIYSHKMDKAAKFIFGSLWINSVYRPKTLQKIYRDLDQNPTSVTSSLLISAGRVPRSYSFPEGWIDISVWARGTMLKSPGVGVIFTGVAGSETLTIEYLKDLTDKATIEQFKEHLLGELVSDI